MKKINTFTPKELSEKEPYAGLVHLSQSYYRVANELRGFARQPPESWPGHYYVFPAVIMFMSCLEAYFKEELGGARYKVEADNFENKKQLIPEIDRLRENQKPYDDFNSWIRAIFHLFDPDGNGIDTNSSTYQNIIALKDLRNAVVHYNPVFIEHTLWPTKFDRILKCALPEIVNAGWVTNLSCAEVADWAHETVKEVIILFCKKTGGNCPFTSQYANGVFNW